MVFFAHTRQGYENYLSLGLTATAPLWVTANVLAEDELHGPELTVANVSIFSYTIDPGDTDAMAGAVLTIAEHHPGHTIWAEGMAVFD
ncbi:hypothetical protein LJR118_003100 [Acidovorax sp. LjRoot118]|uniref:hypothetical protein n=1 Tax=unclassified Acidovorax TaxID=2684926 RepID=UPI00070BA097|nr:hypothetical protein [Acidovorax sp. Root219]KRC28239.1 hypothetical protein ASE28_02425 [Acidovorax sp. Root219]